MQDFHSPLQTPRFQDYQAAVQALITANHRDGRLPPGSIELCEWINQAAWDRPHISSQRKTEVLQAIRSFVGFMNKSHDVTSSRIYKESVKVAQTIRSFISRGNTVEVNAPAHWTLAAGLHALEQMVRYARTVHHEDGFSHGIASHLDLIESAIKDQDHAYHKLSYLSYLYCLSDLLIHGLDATDEGNRFYEQVWKNSYSQFEQDRSQMEDNWGPRDRTGENNLCYELAGRVTRPLWIDGIGSPRCLYHLKQLHKLVLQLTPESARHHKEQFEALIETLEDTIEQDQEEQLRQRSLPHFEPISRRLVSTARLPRV